MLLLYMNGMIMNLFDFFMANSGVMMGDEGVIHQPFFSQQMCYLAAEILHSERSSSGGVPNMNDI